MDTVADRLRHARGKRGLTGFELAIRAKVRPETVSRIERGVSTPKSQTLDAIADALLVRPEWLSEGEGEMDRGAASAPATGTDG